METISNFNFRSFQLHANFTLDQEPITRRNYVMYYQNGASQCSVFTTLQNFAWIRKNLIIQRINIAVIIKNTMSSFDLCPFRSCLVL